MVSSLPATGCSIRMQYITRDLRNRGGLGLDKVDNPPPLVTNLSHSALSATDIRAIMLRRRSSRFIAFKVSNTMKPEIMVISRNSEFSQSTESSPEESCDSLEHPKFSAVGCHVGNRTRNGCGWHIAKPKKR